MTYSNGDIYDGYWFNGYRQGKGKMTQANGISFEGDW